MTTLFPKECSDHVQTFVKNTANGKAIIDLMLQEDDAEAFAAYLNYKEKTFKLQEVDALLEASKEAVNIRSFLVNWKQIHYSPAQQEKLQKIQEARALGIRPPTVADWEKLWDWSKLEDKSLRLDKYKGEESVPIIPNKIGRNTVSSLGSHLFLKNSILTDVVIPDGVVTIEWGAFSGCENLKSVIVPQTVTRIGEYAFQECNKLANISIPECIESIGDGAFLGCDALQREDGMLIVGKKLFHYNGEKETVIIPDGVTGISLRAFNG